MNEESLFSEALGKKGEARAAFLDEHCKGDVELRRRLEALLRADDNPDPFLEAAAPVSVGTANEPIGERPGMVIGPYKLLQQIGEGGMGTVWMAEQTEPVRRKVALKVIKPGMDSRQVIARFEAERQALAMMDHVNIARVFDGGTTDRTASGLACSGQPTSEAACVTGGGRPYFVMELVHGVPITKYCDDNHLTPRERLELFVPVCQAIQHAHQKGIIHRDIKPSNVMVTLYDGKPVPKVIDFGVAKATEQKLTERTLFTQYGALVGTLEYMSPEQAEMSALGVDTRSDIYSLGVLLYELLTGNTPLSHKTMKEAAYAEILRMIKEDEPPKPSTRLSDSGEALASISANRHTEPAKLTKLVKGELDWIVMKCLEKDRNRRYETANAFAADVQRYLNDETVQACPPSIGYRFRKFARRNKAALSIASAIALVLLLAVVGLSVSNAQISKEQKQTEKALLSEQEAKNDLTKSLQREQQVLSFQRFALAERELAVNNIGRAEALLEECPEDTRGLEWQLLKGLRTGPQVLRGSGAWVLDVAISADGQHVASAGLGPLSLLGELILWDAADGRKIASLSGHLGPVVRVAFSPDGKHLASAGVDQVIHIWDTATRKSIRTLRGHGGIIFGLAFHPDGTRLASASMDQSVRVWDLASGDEKLCYRGHGGNVSCVAFSPDGHRLASWGVDNLVRIWDARTGADLMQLSGHSGRVFNLAFRPDGQRIASAGALGLTLWDTTTGQNLQLLQGIDNVALRVVFSPDGQRLIAGCWDRTVKIWDLATSRETLVLRGHGDMVTGVALSADGRRLASASFDGTVRLWYPPSATGRPGPTPRVLRGHTAELGGMAFSADGRQLASGSLDRTIRIWDLATDKVMHVLKGHAEPLISLAFTADGKQLTSVSFEGTMLHWDAATGELVRSRPKHIGPVLTTGFNVAFRPDGQRLASTSDDMTVQVWDVATGQQKAKITPQFQAPPPLTLAYSADGRRVAGAVRGGIKVWDAETGAELHSFGGSDHMVHWLAFRPDGSQLATASWDGLVILWDIASGKKVHTLRGHTDRVLQVAFSPDGRRLVSSGCDNTALLWDAQTGKKLATLTGHIGYAMSLAFSGDGKTLATASGHRYRGEILLWDVAGLETKQKD